MGDFLLQFDQTRRGASFLKSAQFLKFHDHVSLQFFEFPDFSLALSTVDNPFLWGPYDSDTVLIALCGRVDFEDEEWNSAERLVGEGGLAAKRIAQLFHEKGPSSLQSLSGNFAVLLFDKVNRRFWLVTDLCGAQPVYKSLRPNSLSFASHPDALAVAIDEAQNWNETSLLEFLLTSSVTPPFTYYKRVESILPGTEISIELNGQEPVYAESSYYQLEYRGRNESENDLAEELAQAIKLSVRKRSNRRFGPVAVALSGGLDSRTILAATSDRSNLFAFSTFNKENFEFQSARAIAEALDVKFIPLPRQFEFYGETAELGIRINGGMGTFANNHFLGLASRLRELDTQTLLTGCYFDYLFKALPLNLEKRGLFRRESLGSYSHAFYFDHYRMDLPSAKGIKERLDGRFPEPLRVTQDEETIFRLEAARTIPFFQEPDNAQRLIPQRVLFSYLPVADRSILEVYSRIPYRYKLNRSIFKKTMERICGPKVAAIPDTNTGAPANAGHFSELAHASMQRLTRKLHKFKPQISTDGSWPDWEYYIPNSSKLEALWKEPCPVADDFFRKFLPGEDIKCLPSDYKGKDQFFFVQLLTLKLWFSQRC